MKIEEVSLKIKQIKENVNKVIIGKEKIHFDEVEILMQLKGELGCRK